MHYLENVSLRASEASKEGADPLQLVQGLDNTPDPSGEPSGLGCFGGRAWRRRFDRRRFRSLMFLSTGKLLDQIEHRWNHKDRDEGSG
jgi:hypothetical protein